MANIILVEDNQDNADMIIRILESVGHSIEHHTRGFAGAKAIRLQKPDLILMDFDLPDIDGRNLVLVLKKQLKDIPIIAVTARVGPIEEKIARRFGCDAYLAKPFEPHELVKVVQDVLGETVIEDTKDEQDT